MRLCLLTLFIGMVVGITQKAVNTWSAGMQPREVREQLLRNSGKALAEVPVRITQPAIPVPPQPLPCDWMYDKALKWATEADTYVSGPRAEISIAWARMYKACRDREKGR